MKQPAVKVINLDAQNWNDPLDFYHSLLLSVGAPEWHGKNVNALTDSIVYGGINKVEPPFVVRISNMQNVPESVGAEVTIVIEAIARHRAHLMQSKGRDCQVEFEVNP